MIHFTHSEFDSPDQKGSGKNMQQSFLNMLDDAREIADISFIVNSGFRTKQHNKKVGGKSGSSHLKGYAVDLKAKDSRSRFIMLHALIAVGFTRIGIGKTFIHVDNDPNKDPQVTWLY
jgi:uncharacterized protein YcbK (DUF882 family)